MRLATRRPLLDTPSAQCGIGFVFNSLRPTGATTVPTSWAACCGRTRPVEEGTGSRSGPSGRLPAGGWPPAPGCGRSPVRRWLRSRDFDPGGASEPARAGIRPARFGLGRESLHEPLEGMPRQPHRTVVTLAGRSHHLLAQAIASARLTTITASTGYESPTIGLQSTLPVAAQITPRRSHSWNLGSPIASASWPSAFS